MKKMLEKYTFMAAVKYLACHFSPAIGQCEAGR